MLSGWLLCSVNEQCRAADGVAECLKDAGGGVVDHIGVDNVNLPHSGPHVFGRAQQASTFQHMP